MRGHPAQSVSTYTWRLDWTSCHANHSTCLVCFRKYLSSFRTLAQSDMHRLDIRLLISLLANCISILSAARKLSLAAMDLNLYASSWSNSVSISLISTLLPVTSDPFAFSESQFFDDQVDTSRIRFVLDSGIGPLHDPIQDCRGLHVMKVWPEGSPHFGLVLVVEDFCHVLELPSRCPRP